MEDLDSGVTRIDAATSILPISKREDHRSDRLSILNGRATGHSERTFFASEERSLLVLLGQSDVFVEER